MGDESCVTPADVAQEIELNMILVVSIKTARTGFTLGDSGRGEHDGERSNEFYR
jgi:hypothetical protein